MTLARKDYKCDLCAQPIPKGTDYHREDVTPWTSHPDYDAGYAAYHTHNDCETIWQAMRDPGPWEIPPLDVWEQMVAEYQQLKAAEKTPQAATA